LIIAGGLCVNAGHSYVNAVALCVNAVRYLITAGGLYVNAVALCVNAVALYVNAGRCLITAGGYFNFYHCSFFKLTRVYSINCVKREKLIDIPSLFKDNNKLCHNLLPT
jgi:hypothetical protein